MSDKIVLQELASLQNQNSAKQIINENFDQIAEKIDTLLSRDGDSPNQMETNLNMNNYRVTNLGTPVNPTDAVRLQDIENIDLQGPAVDSFTGNGSQVTFSLSEDPYEDNIKVYVDGVYQHQDTYSHSGTSLTFSEAPPSGSKIEVFSNTEVGSGGGGGGATTANNVSFSPTGNLSSTDVQSALQELDSEKAANGHNHTVSAITDFQEAVEDVIGTKISAGANISVTYNDVTGFTTIAGTGTIGTSAGSVSFTPVGGISSNNVQLALQELDTEKAPVSHTHVAANITDLSEFVEDTIGAKVQAGANISVSYNDGTGITTISGTGGGSSSNFVTPEDFGAVGNGVADDSDAVEQALRSNLPCFFQNYYRITRQVTFGNTISTTQLGKLVFGQGKKHIVMSGSSPGIVCDIATPGVLQEYMVTMRDFTVMVDKVHTDAAIHITTTGGSGSVNRTFHIDNVHVFGTFAGYGALYGIRLTNQRGGVIHGCNFQGRRDLASGSYYGAGVYLDGTGDPVEIDITSCRAYFHNVGYQVMGTHEGVTIDKCVTVAVNYGVYVSVDENPISGDNEGKPLFKVTNGHYNAFYGGVALLRARDFIVTGNDFLVWDGGTSYIGIQATTAGGSSQYGYISGNRIQDATTGSARGTNIGVYLAGHSTGVLNTIVGENRYISLVTGLRLESTARNVKYSAGSIYAACTVNVSDSGTGNTEYAGSGGGGGGMTDAQLLNRVNHTGFEPYATKFAKSSGSQGGALVLEKPDSSSLAADVVTDVSNGTFRVFENGGSTRGASLDLAAQGSVSTTAFITSVNQGVYAAAGAQNAIGNYALLIQADSFGAAGGTVSGSNLYYAHTAGYGAIVGVGTWRRMGETSAAGQVTLFQRVA